MSIFETLEDTRRTVDDILENKECYVLIDRNNEKLKRFSNMAMWGLA
jgi:hypothetical protein